MSTECFSPKQRVEIASYLQKVSSCYNADFLYNTASEISWIGGFHPLVEMERILREIHSDSYMIAIPAVNCVIAANREIIMPHSGDKKYQFLLLVVVGLENAQKWMSDLQIDPEQNMANLANTGLLFEKKGRMLHEQEIILRIN